MPNELLVLVGGFAFFGWLQPLRHSYARYRIVAEWGTVIECVQTGLLFFGICGVFLLSAGILVCRYEKKQLREMSFFAEKGSVTEIGPAWNGSLPVRVNGRSVWH